MSLNSNSQMFHCLKFKIITMIIQIILLNFFTTIIIHDLLFFYTFFVRLVHSFTHLYSLLGSISKRFTHSANLNLPAFLLDEIILLIIFFIIR